MGTEKFSKAVDIAKAKTISLRVLAQVAGGNPKSFYRDADFSGADLRGQDLRGFDISAADLRGIRVDFRTRADPAYEVRLVESGLETLEKIISNAARTGDMKSLGSALVELYGVLVKADRLKEADAIGDRLWQSDSQIPLRAETLFLNPNLEGGLFVRLLLKWLKQHQENSRSALILSRIVQRHFPEDLLEPIVDFAYSHVKDIPSELMLRLLRSSQDIESLTREWIREHSTDSDAASVIIYLLAFDDQISSDFQGVVARWLDSNKKKKEANSVLLAMSLLNIFSNENGVNEKGIFNFFSNDIFNSRKYSGRQLDIQILDLIEKWVSQGPKTTEVQAIADVLSSRIAGGSFKGREIPRGSGNAPSRGSHRAIERQSDLERARALLDRLLGYSRINSSHGKPNYPRFEDFAEEAMLLEAASDGSTPAIPIYGSVEWTADRDENGWPLIRAIAEIDSYLTLRLTIRVNSDPSLPASHLIEFDLNLGPRFDSSSIASMPGVLLKNEKYIPGQPLVGASAQVVENQFLFAMSSEDKNLSSNLDLILHNKWMDLAIIYANGRNAILTLGRSRRNLSELDRAIADWSNL